MCAKANGWPASPSIRSGTVDPEGNVLGFWPGDIYVNTETNTVWYFSGTPNTSTGWFQIIAGSVGSFITSGSPEGVLVASPPSTALDPVARLIYLKLTGTGNTGWIELLAF